MEFGIDHVAFEEAKASLNEQIKSAIRAMLTKQASGCTVTLTLKIDRPDILDMLMGASEVLDDGEELKITHDAKVKVSFEYNKKGFNQHQIRVVRDEYNNGYKLVCDDPQISMFENEEELNE